MVNLSSCVVAIGAVFPSWRRPEYWFFAGDVAILSAITAAVALTGGIQSPTLWLMVVALVAGAGRHTDRGLLVYAGLIALATAIACLLAVNRHVGYGDLRFTGFLTTATAVAILVITLRRAEREHREQSLVDPLTGTLNRLALMRRLEELRAQARLGQAVCA